MILPDRAIAGTDVAAHYDELDRFYREVWGEHVHHGLWLGGAETPETAVRQLVHHVADLAGVAPGSRVCDVGCGYGAAARMIAGEYGAHVTGITLSEAQHRYALSKKGGPTYLLGDWLHNDLPAASFDAVIALESTEHMADKSACFDQACRVLRHAGRLVVCAWLAAERPRAWERRHLLEPICRESRLPGMGSAGEYRDLLEDSGLRVELFEDLTDAVRRTWSICIRRTLERIRRERRYRSYLLSARNRNRSFAVALFRIWLAYRTGALRYGLFAAIKEERSI